ncbi:L-ectoine synthase [Caenispirillum salinarum AK4]|uniref:L-ectoine synthase n=1 Tax=Caenispirillum salinarum AK4 TaxID=1238182 RepID=K9GQZ2_9PROT|nr:ectoine synthase [Caenispirillum salinarum]EKV27562.1 L-ectoine synthase [Caenispirillum salinarum AK4]
MIVRKLEELKGTDAEFKAAKGTWTSRRMLLARDKMGFSFHDTLIHAGTETYIHYANHLEAVYCVGGKGELQDLDNGVTYPLYDGVMYALNGHERHYLRAEEELRMICVFNPPLTGREDHDENGVYPLLTEED